MTRDNSIDALKGLAIVLVVAGHSLGRVAEAFRPEDIDVLLLAAPAFAFRFIYSFHMPLFAFVSGLVLWPPRDRPLGAQIMRRARGLLIPYFGWFLAFWVVALLTPPAPAEGFGAAVANVAVGEKYYLWYLYALFISTVLLALLVAAPRTRITLPVSSLVLIIWASELVLPVPNVLFLSSVVWIYPFVVFGYLMAPHKPWVVLHRRSIVVTGAVAFLPLFFLRFPVFAPGLPPIEFLVSGMQGAGQTTGVILDVLLRYACASAAVVALFALFIGREGRIVRALVWPGTLSLGIYAIHDPALTWLSKVGISNVLILFVVSLGVSVLLTALLRKAPLANRILLGENIAAVKVPTR